MRVCTGQKHNAHCAATAHPECERQRSSHFRRSCVVFVLCSSDFACLLYGMLKHKLSLDTLETIIKDAVEIEKAFICDAIPCALIGMNAGMMSTYIESGDKTNSQPRGCVRNLRSQR